MTPSKALARVDTGDGVLSDKLLAALANRYHQEVTRHGRGMVEAAWNAGQALLIAKTLCEHGEWLPWLAASSDGSQQTASRYTCDWPQITKA